MVDSGWRICDVGRWTVCFRPWIRDSGLVKLLLRTELVGGSYRRNAVSILSWSIRIFRFVKRLECAASRLKEARITA